MKNELQISSKFQVVNIHKKRYIVINKNSSFVSIPWFVQVNYNSGKLTLSANEDLRTLKQTIEALDSKTAYPCARKLVFKGLGLKFALVNNSNDQILELKLGFSHLVRIKLPLPRIQVKTFKNSIVVTCSSLATLKNFIYTIKRLKMPNAYKGKGIWYKNEKKKLKVIKKN